MDTNSKIIFYLLMAITLVVLTVSYYRYFVLENIVFFIDEETVPGSLDGVIELINKLKNG